MSELITYRSSGYDDEPPRSPQPSTDDDDDMVMYRRDLDESFAVLEAISIAKPHRNNIPKHDDEIAALKPSILHCWPLLFGRTCLLYDVDGSHDSFEAVLYLAGAGFGVSKLVKAGWIDPEYGNATYAQYREDSVLGESCRSVDHAVPWRELKRKLKRCRRHEYYVRQLSSSIWLVTTSSLCLLQDPMHDDCHACPAAAPEDKIFAVFWETQNDCTRLVEDLSTRYVTHVMWSFAEPLEDGTINTKLQFWDDDHIRDCIGQLRMFVVIILLSFVRWCNLMGIRRCIKSMIAVGGASFRERFLPLKSPDNLARFKATAVQLVQLYCTTHPTNVFPNMWIFGLTFCIGGVGLDAVQHPDEPRYLLSWDEFPYAWDPPQPDNADYKGCIRYTEGEDGWHRCYEPRISNLVDFVNVMFYNINGGDGVYRAVIEDTLPNKAAAVIPKNKIVVGACCGMGCVTLQPPGQEVFNAGNGSAYYKGTMLWSSTIDILYENSSSTNRMGRAGNYGVKMPFRMPPP
ncbi:hypothetical protein DYB37_003363 [Aphanomyces astaci]|uniref:GH18 domain-containing protein n=1 Tax=Aphanomyces astaci TaxID=112090 RepID=A0A3R7BQ19_APHAT|nr:hypothetical protein DYB37_003363 [Aphanomyces astaci]